MAPIVIRYPLDPTGVNADNLIVEEKHKLNNKNVRTFVTYCGGFFSESIVVKDVHTQEILIKDRDYFCTELYQIPTAKYGKEICSVIVIKNTNVSNIVSVTYQAIGGPWGSPKQAIIQMFDKVRDDTGPVWWNNIKNKPTAFRAAHHLHDIGDPYGFEFAVAELEQIHQAILMVDRVNHDEIYDYIDVIVNGLADRVVDEIYNHTQSGDHDWRYFTKDGADDHFVNHGEAIDITLEGPITVYQGTNYTWKITNYDAFSNYTISANQGIVTLNKDVVRYVLDANTPALDNLFITITRDRVSRQFELNLITLGIVKPTITIDTQDDVCNLLTPTITLSDFIVIPAATDTLKSTDMQLANDLGFTDIIWQQSNVTSGVNKFTVTLPELDIKKTYYFRGRFNGNTYTNGSWNTVIIGTHNQSVANETINKMTTYQYQYDTPTSRLTNYNSEVITNTSRTTTFDMITTWISGPSLHYSYISPVIHPITGPNRNVLVNQDTINDATYGNWGGSPGHSTREQQWLGFGFCHSGQGIAKDYTDSAPTGVVNVDKGDIGLFGFDSYQPSKKIYGWWNLRWNVSKNTTVSRITNWDITTFIPVSRLTYYNSTVGRYTNSNTQRNTGFPVGRYTSIQKNIEYEPGKITTYGAFTGYIKITERNTSFSTNIVVDSDKNTTHITTWQTKRVTSVFNTSTYTCQV